jgi:hypothetical protein
LAAIAPDSDWQAFRTRDIHTDKKVQRSLESPTQR